MCAPADEEVQVLLLPHAAVIAKLRTTDGCATESAHTVPAGPRLDWERDRSLEEQDGISP
jgi:hypothetical protein